MGIRETEPNVADILRRATFDAYERVITLCIDRGVDALLVAGDIFDGPIAALPHRSNSCGVSNG